MHPTYITRRTLLASALALLALAACSETVGDPDGDDKRGAAKPVEIGQVVTDTVDPPIDSLDWKIIQLPAQGFLTVTVFWDDPSIDGSVELVDKYGITVREVPRDSSVDNDQITVRAEEASFYFVRVESKNGKSVYSVRAELAADGDGEEVEPLPEFVSPIEPGSEPGAEVAANGGGGGGGGGAAKPAETTLPPLDGGQAAAGATAQTPPPGTNPLVGLNTPVSVPKNDKRNDLRPTAKIEDIVEDFNGPNTPTDGRILRVIPQPKGGAEITIDLGSRAGVLRDAVGEIIMSDDKRLEGGRFKVVEVFGSSARCLTNAPANQVNAAKKIIVKIPKA